MSIFDDRFKKTNNNKASNDFFGNEATQIDKTTELYHRLKEVNSTIETLLANLQNNLEGLINNVSGDLQEHINDKNNPHETEIDNLKDVLLSGLTDGEGLVYRVSIGKWVNETVGGGGGGGSSYGSREVYYSNSNPTVSVNPSYDGALWINYSSGEIFVCKDKTSGSNIWIGDLGSVIKNVSTSNLFAEYIADNISGTTWADTSGNGYNGTIYGGATTTTIDGYTVLEFDGSDDYVDISSCISGWANDNMTAVVWYKGNIALTSSSYAALVSRGGSGESVDTNLQSYSIAGDGYVQIFTETGSGTNHDHYRYVGIGLDDNQWHFISYVIGSGVAKVYADGKKWISFRFTNSDSTASYAELGRNAKNTTNYFKGYLRSVRLYNTQLSEEDILALYNEGK